MFKLAGLPTLKCDIPHTLIEPAPLPRGTCWVVLCRVEGATPFVTWRVDSQGGCYWGHYHRSLPAAVADFTSRCES